MSNLRALTALLVTSLTLAPDCHRPKHRSFSSSRTFHRRLGSHDALPALLGAHLWFRPRHPLIARQLSHRSHDRERSH